MAGLPDSVLAKMREKARAIKERQSASQFGPKAPRWDLTGKNSIVQPGAVVIARFLPRWDFAQRYVRGADNKVTLNPKYVFQFPWFEALEHWWDTPDGKGGERPNREWCLKTADPEADCPVCDASAELNASSDADERKHGKRIAARETFGLNAVIGGTGQRRMAEDGRPDIRIMFIQESILEQLAELISSESEEFRRGDVTDIKEGYNLKFSRPQSQGQRWKLDCAPKPSVLYETGDAAWKTWVSQLHDIPAIVQAETLTSDALYKAFHGVAPAQGSTNGASRDVAPESPGDADEFESVPGTDESTTVSESPDLGFDLPPDPAEAPVPGKKPSAPQKAPVRR